MDSSSPFTEENVPRFRHWGRPDPGKSVRRQTYLTPPTVSSKLSEHSRFNDPRCSGVGLFGPIEHETVTSVEGDGPRVSLFHPEHRRVLGKHPVEKVLPNAGSVAALAYRQNS